MLHKLWSRDQRFMIKSCVSVVFIGLTVAGAILIIRLIGEQRLQRFLNRMPIFRRRPEVEKLIGEAYVPNNRT